MAIVRTIQKPPPWELTARIKRLQDRWAKGKSIVREMNDLRILNTLELFDGEIYDDLPWDTDLVRGSDPRARKFQQQLSPTEHAMATSLQGSTSFQQERHPRNEDTFEVGLGNAHLNASIAWHHHAALQLSDTPSYFRLSEGLATSLMATELRGVLPEDVQMPMPGFFLEIPKGLLQWYNSQTGYHDIELLGLAERCKGVAAHTGAMIRPGGDIRTDWVRGHRLLVVVFGSANANSVGPDDDGCGFYTIPLHTPGVPIEDMHAHDERVGVGSTTADNQGGRVGSHQVSGIEIREVLRHLTINFLLYLNSENADVQHVNADKIASLKRQRIVKGKHFAKARLTQLEADSTFLVGTRVAVDPTLRDYVGSGATTNQRNTAQFRSLVRGHWRKQAHGPGRTLRKLIRIAPHTRGGSLEKVVGHDYRVK